MSGLLHRHPHLTAPPAPSVCPAATSADRPSRCRPGRSSRGDDTRVVRALGALRLLQLPPCYLANQHSDQLTDPLDRPQWRMGRPRPAPARPRTYRGVLIAKLQQHTPVTVDQQHRHRRPRRHHRHGPNRTTLSGADRRPPTTERPSEVKRPGRVQPRTCTPTTTGAPRMPIPGRDGCRVTGNGRFR